MWIVSSIPRQSPHGIGSDALGRGQYVYNLDILHRKETLPGRNPGVEAVIGERLRVELELTRGETYILGRDADVPEGDGPIVCVRDVVGLPALPTTSDLLAYRRSTVQVAICGLDPVAARKTAEEAYEASAFVNTNAYAAPEG